jgi:REP element-mobilizing transposase RayT
LGYENLRKNSQFGGALVGKNNAKEKRPFSSKHPMHLVLRSSLAVRERSLLLKNQRIRELLYKQSKKHFVEIKNFANAGNHIHLIVHAKDRAHYKGFLRGISSSVARMVKGIRRGQSKMHKVSGTKDRRSGRFWDFIPWSTIVNNFLALKNAYRYLGLNRFEIKNKLSRKEARQQMKWIEERKRLFPKGPPPLVAIGF